MPTEEVPAQAVVVTPNGDAAPEVTKTEVTSAAPVAAVDATPTPAAAVATAAVDAVKTDVKSKTKKAGPLRLVKGFRAAKWRPKISLDTEKSVADKIRRSLNSRRIKYERFVQNVLGKASPLGKDPVPVVVQNRK